MVCQRCDAPLRPPQTKWCSDNCRKRACDDAHRATCIDCGAVKPPRSGWFRHDEPQLRCSACEYARRAAIHEERVQRFVAMYERGLTIREIAAELGWGEKSSPPELTEAHRRGLIGYRHRGYGDAA